MLRTPLKNSKNVNKPFKSPLNSSTPSNKNLKKNSEKKVVKKDLSKSCEKDVQKDISKSIEKNIESEPQPSSSKTVEAKRVLQLDDDDDNKEQDKKRHKLIEIDKEKMKKLVPEDATKGDLFILKRKIFEMRQELDCLKSRERCTKKHDPKALQISIDTWTSACQNALETICSELSERNGRSTKISEVLSMLGIPETIVHYSESEDSFT